jgi:hypothetical protein
LKDVEELHGYFSGDAYRERSYGDSKHPRCAVALKDVEELHGYFSGDAYRERSYGDSKQPRCAVALKDVEELHGYFSGDAYRERSYGDSKLRSNVPGAPISMAPKTTPTLETGCTDVWEIFV